MKTILLSFAILFAIVTFGQQTKYVDTEVLNLRAGAGKNYAVLEKILQGQKVTVLTEQGKWSEIKLENGKKGFVSTKFLSENEISSSSKSSNKKNSWIGYVFVIGFVIYFLNKLFGNSSSSSNFSTRTSTNMPEIWENSRNSAVYRFRIKGNGSAGGFQYVNGMNVEVAVTGIGANGSPFNNIVEKLFVQEIVKKYNVEPRFQSGIKMLFKSDSLHVERM